MFAYWYDFSILLRLARGLVVIFILDVGNTGTYLPILIRGGKDLYVFNFLAGAR